jgi:hypothetical protein
MAKALSLQMETFYVRRLGFVNKIFQAEPIRETLSKKAGRRGIRGHWKPGAVAQTVLRTEDHGTVVET